MARTFRKDHGENRRGCVFIYNPHRAFKQTCLYNSHNTTFEGESDYIDRTRHTSISFPHLTSAYEDVFGNNINDKWRYTRKPDYCTKK